MMMQSLHTTLLGARTDDAAGLIQILVVIIFFAIHIISSIVKNRGKNTPRQQGGRPTRSSAPAPSQDQQARQGRRSLPSQDPGQRLFGAEPAKNPTEKPVPAKLRKVTLRPNSISPSRVGAARRHTTGGFREVLGGKSRLDRFLEAKLEPKRQPIPERQARASGETPDEMAAGLEEFGKLEVSESSLGEHKAAMESLQLNSENIADAIVFAEILGKPLALRDA